MAQLPTDRSIGNTRAEHISDHNELHRLHDVIDALGPLATDAEVAAAVAVETARALAVEAAKADLVGGVVPDAQIPGGVTRDSELTAAFAAFVAGAPGALDQWLELVAAIQADQTGLAALTTTVAGKETPAGAQAKVDTHATTEAAARSAAIAALSSTYVAKNTLLVNAKDHGAIGDGATNDTAALITATAAAVTAKADLFLKRTANGYKARRSVPGDGSIGAIALPPGVGLASDGAAVIFDPTSGGSPIISAFSTLGATTTITASTTAATTNLTVTSSAGFAVGDDVVIVLGDAAYDPSEPDFWLNAFVSAIPDATHITIDRPVAVVMTLGATAANNRKITKVTARWTGAIGSVDLQNPGLEVEYGLRMLNARGVTIDRLSGADPGAGLICAQYTDNVNIREIDLRRSKILNAQLSKGVGMNFAECRNIHFGSVRLADCENAFINLEARCDAITFDNLEIDNGYPGRSALASVFAMLWHCNAYVEEMTVLGQAAPLLSQGVSSGSTLRIGHLIHKTATRCPADLSLVERALTVDGTTYAKRKRWTRTFEVPKSSNPLTIAAPAGYWRSARVKASSATGLTTMYLVCPSTGGAISTGALTTGAFVDVPLAGMLDLGHNQAPDKSIAVYTDATVPAGTYYTVEIDYFEDPTSLLPAADVQPYAANLTDLAGGLPSFEINGFAKAHSNVNFAATPAANVAFARGARVSSAAQNDEVVFHLVGPLQAGTWTLALTYRQLTSAGIITFAVSPDATTWTDIGTLDQYSAAPTSDMYSEVVGLTIPAGTKYLRAKMATKNAGSSAYAGSIGVLSGVRTGA